MGEAKDSPAAAGTQESERGAVDTQTIKRLRANVPRIQALGFAWMFMVFMPVIVPYLSAHGLGMSGVLRLQAIFAIAVVILEVPSGYASDLLGRKGCLIVAGVMHGVAYVLLAQGRGFWDFAAFELLAAVAVSLYSGTDVALLYDSLEALGEPVTQKRLLGRRLFWMQAGETVAALLGGALVLVSLRQVALVNAVVGWVPLLIILGLHEPPRARFDASTHLENLRTIVRELVTESPLLRLILFDLVAYGLATLIAVWAFQGIWKETGVPLGLFGVLWAAYNLVVALVGGSAHRIEQRLGAQATLRLIGWLPVLGYLGMGLCTLRPGIWTALGAVLFGFCFQVGRGLTQVVIKDGLNSRVRTEFRATANSIASLGVRLLFVVLGPTLGWLIDLYGYSKALCGFAGLFLVVHLVLNRSLQRQLGPVSGLGYHSPS